MAKAFDKFINKPVKSAKIKEAFRQEKKAAVKERREAIEKRFEEKRQQKQAQYEARQQQGGYNSSRPVSRSQTKDGPQGPRPRTGGSTTGKKWDNRNDRSGDVERTPYQKKDGQQTDGAASQRSTSRPATASGKFKPQNRNSSGTGPQRSPAYKKTATGNRSSSAQRPAVASRPAAFNNPKNISDQSRNPSYGRPVNNDSPKKPEDRRPKAEYRQPATGNRLSSKANAQPAIAPKPRAAAYQPPVKETKPEAIEQKLQEKDNQSTKVITSSKAENAQKPFSGRISPAIKYLPAAAKRAAGISKKSSFTKSSSPKEPVTAESMPLNKFLAHAGICSRRDAAEKVRQGLAAVNGQVITEPAFKIAGADIITYEGKKIQRSRNQVYILMNKPKDCITTSDDPQGRTTVMDIIRPATQERVYPVGRLDRNTSGVLLLTNDGDLAQQLSHPSFEVRKIYEVKLDKPLAQNDFDKILNGIVLEDGETHANSLAYSDSKDRSVVGIEIHNGRNRIVRRMFEHLGYDVRGLDRVMYANLTKKNVDRGNWRFLSEKEVRLLKYFNKSKKKAQPESQSAEF